jgi:hypothetical protein
MQFQLPEYCSVPSGYDWEKEESYDVADETRLMAALVISDGAEAESCTGADVKLLELEFIRLRAAAAYLKTPHSVKRCLNIRGLGFG